MGYPNFRTSSVLGSSASQANQFPPKISPLLRVGQTETKVSACSPCVWIVSRCSIALAAPLLLMHEPFFRELRWIWRGIPRCLIHPFQHPSVAIRWCWVVLPYQLRDVLQGENLLYCEKTWSLAETPCVQNTWNAAQVSRYYL